jgi:hypothetical protein
VRTIAQRLKLVLINLSGLNLSQVHQVEHHANLNFSKDTFTTFFTFAQETHGYPVGLHAPA